MMRRTVALVTLVFLAISSAVSAQDTPTPTGREKLAEKTGKLAPALFDANGSYGRPSTGGSDCPSIAERLSHMNQFGIERSLVWNTEAEEGHSLSCNQSLLDEIARTPGARGRIVPAMIVSGLIVYERGGVARLAEQMSEGGTGALRFVSWSGLMKLMQCEPVMHAVQDHKPFVLLKWKETDTRDILDFTATFPEVPVVLTDVTEPDSAAVLDLMGQRSNLLIDTSGWHTVQSIRTVVDRFGAERILFGTGPRSNNDVAIVALGRSGISDEQQGLIAHGNLERLAGLTAEHPMAPTGTWRPLPMTPTRSDQSPVDEYNIRRMPSLFDANGNFGRSSDWPTIADRLAHMDRLGIERSLVWNVQARGENPLDGNQRLLDEIARTAGAPERIIPALVVSGLIPEDQASIERLAMQMREAGTGALRFVYSGRRRLMQCGPVVNAVRDLKPFVLVRWGETHAYDILDFAEKYPDVPIILTDVMWTGGIGALDLMRRRQNVFIEISSWHTWDGVRLIVEHFGAERILFGTGYRAHNGAAIGTLARAEISDEECARIAHGTLDALTGLSPKNQWADVSTGNTLWKRYLAGEALGVDMVDAHGHIGPIGGFVLANQDERAQIPVVLKAVDRLGQRTMIISGLAALMGPPVEGNEFLHELLKPHADRLSIYAVFNPLYADELVPKLDEWFADPQFVGFKILCSYWRIKVTDPRFEPMWEYANEHRLPVLMHSWDDPWCSPAMTRDIVRKYPDLALLIGHSGGGTRGRREAEELAAEFPNVFLEWCGSFTTPKRWEETLKIVPVTQVVYGTDAAGHGIDWELGRLLSLDVPEETITGILGENMRRVLARRR